MGGGGDPGGGETLRRDPDAAVNFAWTLSAAFMVFFMQAGFALIEAGSIRSRSVANVMAKNMMDFMTAGIAFWAFGFAIMFGGSNLGPGLESGNKLIGLSGFFLADAAYDVTTLLYWMFHVMFAATAATIVSGAMAERTKLNAYMAYTFFVSAVVYPVYGHWVWGGGWLGDLSFIREGLFAADFAGSGVVHGVGGMVALVGALVLGPRTGKFGPDGKPRRIPGHSVAFVVLGTLILLFGWFGFNSGSTTAATELRISVIAANTFLAACGGGLIAYFIRLVETEGRADVHATACGLLGGLVAVTAPVAWVAPWAAVVIGAVGGAVVVYGARFLERRPEARRSCLGSCGSWAVRRLGPDRGRHLRRRHVWQPHDRRSAGDRPDLRRRAPVGGTARFGGSAAGVDPHHFDHHLPGAQTHDGPAYLRAGRDRRHRRGRAHPSCVPRI